MPRLTDAFLEKGAAARHCTIKDFKLEGNTLSYTQVCAGYTLLGQDNLQRRRLRRRVDSTMNGKGAVISLIL